MAQRCWSTVARTDGDACTEDTCLEFTDTCSNEFQDADGDGVCDPLGFTNIDELVAVARTWQDAEGARHRSATNVEPQFINEVVNFNDVLLAFQGEHYPFRCPADRCQDTEVTPCP